MQLHNLTTGAGTAAASVQTGLAGQFAFSGISQENWEVQPQKTGDLGYAVDISDAVAILKATVGALTLNSQQRLAADVSGDGLVDITDAVLVLRYTVGAITRFPVVQRCNSDWAFVPEPVYVPNQVTLTPQIGPTACQPDGSICFQPLTTQANNQNFAAVLFGDCTGDWRPGTGAALSVTSQSPAGLIVGQRTWLSGRRLRVPVLVNTAGSYGLSVDLRYDPAQMTPVGVRPTGRRGQILQTNLRVSGLARVAVLSTEPLRKGTAFLMEFEVKRNRSATTPLQIERGTVAK